MAQASGRAATATEESGPVDLGQRALEKKLPVWYIHGHPTVSNGCLSENIGCGHEGDVSKYVKEISTTRDRQTNELVKKLKSGDRLLILLTPLASTWAAIWLAVLPGRLKQIAVA